MPTRNVVLTERQEKLVESLVKSGRYQNASEVLRDGCGSWSSAKRRTAPNSTIEVVRILHDRMDVWHYVPSTPDESAE